MAECGCVTTSAAMILKYHGVDYAPNGSETDPGVLNDYFKQGETCSNNGCSSLGYSYGNVRWNAIGKYSSDANAEHAGQQKVVYKSGTTYNSGILTQELENEQPVILQSQDKGHWFVATGVSDNTFTINDPAYDRTMLDDSAYGNSANAMRMFEKTNSDYSSFEVYSPARTLIMVTDPDGNRTGYDPISGICVQGIINSFCNFEQAYGDPTGNSVSPDNVGVHSVTINTPVVGIYKVQVIDSIPGEYGFTVYASETESDTVFNIFEGDGSPAYLFNYNPEDISEEEVNNPTLEVPIDIVPWKDINEIHVNNKIPIPVAILATDYFNPNEVDRNTIRFGKTGGEDSLRHCLKPLVDMNRDGLGDLMCFFDSSKTNLGVGDGKAIFRANTFDGTKLQGSDFVIIRPD